MLHSWERRALLCASLIGKEGLLGASLMEKEAL